MTPRRHMESLSLRAHVGVWAALLALLLLTLGSAYLRLGWANGAINVAIAAIKALLVMLFFMRLRASRPVLRLAAGAGFVWLLILGGLALADFLSRG